jgi:uncharacterized protein YecT (DUF1311 family)
MPAMRTLLAALAATMLISTAPALADDAETLTQCVDTERKANRDARVCIGKISDPCLQGSGSDTTTSMVECVDREATAWDGVLNAEYQHLIESVPATAIDSVRQAQRAWIALRDADCKVPYDIFEGGSMARIDSANCVLEHNGSRVLQLRIWREMAQPEEYKPEEPQP